MIRIQLILSVILFLCLTACQSDVKVDTAEKLITETKEAAKQLKQDAEAVAEDVKEEITPSEPKLLEFYVEEDKDATNKDAEKKASTAASSKKAPKEEAKVVKKTKPKAPAKKAPKMKFENNTFAFGVIKPGEVIEHKFEFTNTGQSDLIITDAKATCGCTQPSFPFVPIPPGEKGFIGVKYDSTGKLGSQKPTVTLTTNASPKTQKVYLEGLVISEMSKN